MEYSVTIFAYGNDRKYGYVLIHPVIFLRSSIRSHYNGIMCINAINANEASKQILRVICATDYKQSRYKASHYGYTFVYFSAEYFFEPQQRKDTKGLIKRYGVVYISKM